MKRLVVFGGPPCSGKSTAGNALGWAHLEMDAARSWILPASAHSRQDRAIAYRAILWAAMQLLRYTDIVICNGGFGHAEDRAACEKVCETSSAGLYVVEFQVPLAVALERNRARQGKHPGLDLTDARVTEIVSTYPWTGAGLTVQGTRPVQELVQEVRSYVLEGIAVAPGVFTNGGLR
jgi:predicted kinase